MSDLPSAPRPRSLGNQDLSRTLDTMATLITVVVAVTILFVARDILVPVAIAILLSFVVSPLVKLLRHIGIPKTLSVMLVVLSAFLLSVGVALVLAKQISDLAADAPKYQATVTQKVESIRGFVLDSPLLKKLNAAVTDVSKMTPAGKAEAPPATKSQPQGVNQAPAPGTADHPMPVQVVEPVPGALEILQKIAGTAASPVATAAFVAIFVVFMLMQREDLRNRFIRLAGSSDLQRTTLAMNDAARRLSRYFLAQVLLNTSFGIVVAIALSIIGVPSAILWGIVAIFMRFIPYVGAIGSGLFPILLAAAVGPGWSMVIETALLFVVIESVVGQVVEPLVYGHHTGISPIAVVLSATFWTWLWGPIGLVLATPLTVCLVVIGRHVERMAFLDIILGDAPVLSPVESFYQRVLAGDVSELMDHAECFLKEHSLTDYCDRVALPALLLAQNDVRRGRLEEDRLAVIKSATDELIADLRDHDAENPHETDDGNGTAGMKPVDLVGPRRPDFEAAWTEAGSILCIAGRTSLDEAAAKLLSDLLVTRSLGTRVAPATTLAGLNAAVLNADGAKLVVLSFLDADLNIAQARFAVRRLRRRVPNVPIVAAFWMDHADQPRTTGLCGDVKSDFCVSNLSGAVDLCLEQARGKAVDLAA